MHDADMSYEVFNNVNKSLQQCKHLKALSYSKNMLGNALQYGSIDSQGEYEIDDTIHIRNKRMEECIDKKKRSSLLDLQKEQAQYMDSLGNLVVTSHHAMINRICLSHCYIGDTGL